MKQITGIKVGKTNITSTYVDNISQSDSKAFTVTAVSLGSMSTIDDYFIYLPDVLNAVVISCCTQEPDTLL